MYVDIQSENTKYILFRIRNCVKMFLIQRVLKVCCREKWALHNLSQKVVLLTHIAYAHDAHTLTLHIPALFSLDAIYVRMCLGLATCDDCTKLLRCVTGSNAYK